MKLNNVSTQAAKIILCGRSFIKMADVILKQINVLHPHESNLLLCLQIYNWQFIDIKFIFWNYVRVDNLRMAFLCACMKQFSIFTASKSIVFHIIYFKKLFFLHENVNRMMTKS